MCTYFDERLVIHGDVVVKGVTVVYVTVQAAGDVVKITEI